MALKLNDLQDSENIAKLLKKEELETIGRNAKKGFDADKTSRARWETSMQEAEKLALQVYEPKTSPWQGAANVKFPLMTIAANQFAARAYPALVKGPDLVKYRVQGKDPGAKAARAARIGAHMSYQLLEEDEGWEEDHDKALHALPILGCVFKKSYYDKTDGHNKSPLVLPKNLVIHYYAKSIEKCERKTEIFDLSPREIKERVLAGIFTKHELTPVQPEAKDSDKRQGITPPPVDEDTTRTLLEQHCYLDLDEDGYKEPYIVTFDQATSKVFRILARWEKVTTKQSIKINELQKRIKAFAEGLPKPQGQPTQEELDQLLAAEQTIKKMQAEVEMLSQQKPKVIKITPVEFYTKIPFMPSPDGGFYDLGFGALLGPLNESVNTILNQLIDAGSLANSSGGFIGSGARMKGGKLRFQLNEWKRVNVAGSTLREAIVPLPVKEPSVVLFQLLSLLITYAERIGSVTDAMVGENPGQNTPAYNMSAMLEQGLQIFNGVFKRVHRSMRAEFRKLYKLNAIYLDDEVYFSYHDSDERVLRLDYHADPKDLIPAADPNASANKEKAQKAQMIAERAAITPGYDPIVVEKRLLESLEIPDANEVYPLVPGRDEQGNETGEMILKFPPQPDPDLELQKEELSIKALQGQDKHDIDVGHLEVDIRLAEAKILEMVARAEKDQDEKLQAELERQLKDLISQRVALTAVAVAEIGAKAKESNGSKAD